MDRLLRGAAILFSTLLVATSAFAEGHLLLAREFLAGLSHENNQYMHGGSLHWRGEKGVFSDYAENEARIDCSGFVNEILKKAGSQTYDRVYQNTYWKKYPQAASYYEAIVKGYGFTRREFSDAQPGDIIAVKFESAARDTGHVMFIDAPPLRMEPRDPVIAGTQQWKLVVIDASSNYGDDDTRWVDGKRHTGVGRGGYRIYTDEGGKIVGYTVGFHKRQYYPVERRQVAVGTPL